MHDVSTKQAALAAICIAVVSVAMLYLVTFFNA
jgi:hypothetical protein